jgi:hypothetical protein
MFMWVHVLIIIRTLAVEFQTARAKQVYSQIEDTSPLLPFSLLYPYPYPYPYPHPHPHPHTNPNPNPNVILILILILIWET